MWIHGGGESAGGGLAAAVSMLARDKGEVKILRLQA
ncbi:MAG: alpha/beta hydrolase fold domain-containing protein [Butyrivibrio sp.]|nr:alpha/beta hydrolase fold domain-containing protein [Butyrivibrio sp.]MBR1640869.1 alpha/beta hydrolase fold domain-containing protein [Butyrivibrio sp.]